MASTPRNVASAATTDAPLDTRSPILLGTYGREGHRQALVRLPSGAVEELSVGDALQGRPVVAIAETHIALNVGGAAQKLWIPGEGGGAAPSAPAPANRAMTAGDR